MDCVRPVRKLLGHIQMHFPCLTFVAIFRSEVILMFYLLRSSICALLRPAEKKGSERGISVSFLMLYIDIG